MILKDMPRITAAVTLVQNNVTQIYTQHTQIYTQHTQIYTQHTQIYTQHTNIYTTHTKSADTGKQRLFNTQRQIDSKFCSEFDDPKTSTSGLLLKK